MSLTDPVIVAVVTYNSAHLIPGLVESLGRGMGGTAYALVVADNSSSDGSADVVRSADPSARVVQMGRNAGYAAGLNAAVADAGSFRAVLVLNPDVRLASHCVPRLLSALEQPGVGVAVPRLEDGDGQLVESMRREPSALRAWADALLGARRAGRVPVLGEVVTGRERYERTALTDWAEGSTQLISAECWAAAGPWDETFFLYSEETDFNLRARDAGHATAFVPEARAVHFGGESATAPALWSLVVVNKLRLYRRRHGLLLTGSYWLALVVREATRSVRGSVSARSALRVLFSSRALRSQPGPDWLADVSANA